MRISCTSVMLPRWDLDQTFARLGELGFAGVELRCRYNPPEPDVTPSFWGRHLCDVSPDNIGEQAPAIRAAAERTRLTVVSLACQTKVGDEQEVRKVFSGAVAINSAAPPMVRLDAEPHDRSKPYLAQFDVARGQYERGTQLAGEYGVKILYEIHQQRVAVSCSRTFELLKELDPQRIGAIYDVPNMIRGSIEDSRLGIELLGDYLAHCHIGNGIPVRTSRDAMGAAQWAWQPAALQEGVADIQQIVTDLRDLGYTGFLSLEDFSPGDDEQKVRSQGAYLRQLL